MAGTRRRKKRVEPTDDWGLLELLCGWPEQLVYEAIRPLVLFGSPVAERTRQTGSSERMLYCKAGRFEAEGIETSSPAGGAFPVPGPHLVTSRWTG